ncbi:hypothetical protein EJB05_34871, partial [Eragrostis curvula]
MKKKPDLIVEGGEGEKRKFGWQQPLKCPVFGILFVLEMVGVAVVKVCRVLWCIRSAGQLNESNPSMRTAELADCFASGGDGGGTSACTGKFYGDNRKHIVIRVANGNTVRALVVDECDSTLGCDKEHNFEPPCGNRVVDGSLAVWMALGLNKDDGQVRVTWSEA